MGRKDAAMLLILALLLVGAAVLRLACGPEGLAFAASETAANLRWTRVLAAVSVGSALAVAGVMLQSLLRNPLASPDLIGVSAGSGLAVVVSAYLGYLATGQITPPGAEPIPAVIGALAAWGEAGRATLRWQHMRYLAEARLATPVSGYVTPLAVDDTGYTLLVALRHSLTDNVLATAIGTWTGDGHTIPAVAHAIPAYAAPRGIADADTPFGSLALDAARAHGFATVGKGVMCIKTGGHIWSATPNPSAFRISATCSCKIASATNC